MHGSILPVTIPPRATPRLKRFCPGGRGAGQIDFL